MVGFVGSNKPWHGLHRLPGIADALPESTILVVGSGPVPLPAHPRVRGPGHVGPNVLPDFLAAMDVAIAPYDPDAPPWFCPLKILDYRAQGLPVVATDIGDCKLLIKDGGQVLTSTNPHAWAKAIRDVKGLPRIPAIRDWGDVVTEALATL